MTYFDFSDELITRDSYFVRLFGKEDKRLPSKQTIYLYLVNEKKAKDFNKLTSFSRSEAGTYHSVSHNLSHLSCSFMSYHMWGADLLSETSFFFLHFLKEVTWKMFYTFIINQHFSPFHSLTESWVLSSHQAFAQFSLASHGIVWLISHVTDKYYASPLSSGSAHMDLHCTNHSRLSWQPTSGFARVL